MSSVFDRLKAKDLLNSPPWFLENNVQLEVIMGSVAYGVSNDTSDMDVYGFCMPPKDYIFPHLRGEIADFSTTGKSFTTWQQHHIEDKETRKEYDICIYSIQRFFRLCMENNPNMVDALFVPRRCVLHSTQVGELVRENRQMFLHKGAWHKFKGYAYGQMHKMKTKNPEGKRTETIEKYGFDVKFAYHVVRLIGEVEQILTTGTLDLEQGREQLKAIRRGEWTMEQIVDYFGMKEKHLEQAYADSKLQHSPNEAAIKDLLMKCIESHYGSIDSVPRDTELKKALSQISAIASGAI